MANNGHFLELKLKPFSKPNIILVQGFIQGGKTWDIPPPPPPPPKAIPPPPPLPTIFRTKMKFQQ